MRNALLATFENQPALLTTGSEKRFESFLGEAFTTLARVEAHNDNNLAMADDFWFSPDDWRSVFRPYTVKKGVLLIPVKGVLLHGVGYQLGNWATGYTYLAKALERGLADPEVKGMAWICDSPGGHVAGNFELQDRIFAARDVKPQRAFAFEGAYSAAYSIASATGNITVSRSGGVGSIGVLRVHWDYSKALENEGIAVTFTQYGKHKTDGSSLKPLPKDVQARWQAEVDELGEEFVSIVARNRGMDAQAVRDTEALCFTAKEATSNGLADAIGSLDDAIAVFAADMSNQEEDDMTNKDASAVVAAAKTKAYNEAYSEAYALGAKQERERFKAIIFSDEGKKRPEAALAAAQTTDMTADQAIKFIAQLPEENVSRADKAFALAGGPRGSNVIDFVSVMNGSTHPEAGSPSTDGTKPSRAEAAFALAGKNKQPPQPGA